MTTIKRRKEYLESLMDIYDILGNYFEKDSISKIELQGVIRGIYQDIQENIRYDQIREEVTGLTYRQVYTLKNKLLTLTEHREGRPPVQWYKVEQPHSRPMVILEAENIVIGIEPDGSAHS